MNAPRPDRDATLTVRVPSALVARLDTVAIRADLPRSVVIRHALTAYLAATPALRSDERGTPGHA